MNCLDYPRWTNISSDLVSLYLSLEFEPDTVSPCNFKQKKIAKTEKVLNNHTQRNVVCTMCN